MHAHPTLWRWTHQLHHGAERMDLLGMAVLHPFDLALTALTTAAATTSLGLSLEASVWSAALAFSAACLQHSNVRTPRWLGFVLGRPEQHAVHHARGVHAHNYAVFPVWDLLFGTLVNPPAGEFPAAYGFWDGGSAAVGRMLLGHDASHPPPP
jgi:sterol desaturase/sphingolipid hydroxylase (fatty acid hydroxylase superfamily)